MPDESPKSATRTKLDEAKFFLTHVESNRFNPTDLGYYVSAFISSARSVLWVMRHEFAHTDGWLGWYSSKAPSPEESHFLENLNTLRVRAVKKETPSFDYKVEFKIPPGGLSEEGKEWLLSRSEEQLVITVFTEDEQPPPLKPHPGITFEGRVENVYPSVSKFADDDIVKIGERYISWLSGLVDECESRFPIEH